MENITTHQAYHDSPSSSQNPTPKPHHTTTPSISSSSSSHTIKPLPPLPPYAPPYEPYHDDPSASIYRDEPGPNAGAASSVHQPAYTDTETDTNVPTDDENIPLAYLLPTDAPPSYSAAIQQSHSYRDTLIQYIPDSESASHNVYDYPVPQQHASRQHGSTRLRDVVIEVDPESGEVVSRSDDVRHGVEKVVAMFVVALMLLSLSGVLGFLAFGW